MYHPGKYSNDSKPNEEIFKDKVVWNQHAGVVEFINTKDLESVTMSHKNGSYNKIDKFGSESLTTIDKREHIIGDSSLEINGSETEYVHENSEKVILGDEIKTVGDADNWLEPMQKIKQAQRELHDKKRLFEVKRTNRKNNIDQAPGQTKSGSHAKCPTHSGNTSKVIKNKTPTKVTEETVNSRTVMNVQDGSEQFETVSGGGGNFCMTCWGKLLSPSSQDGKWATETEKQNIIQKREEIQKRIYEYEKKLGQNKCPNGGSKIETIAKNFIQNIGLVFNDFESFRSDPAGKLVPCGVKIDPMGTTIYTQYRESALVENVDVEKFPGGSYELNICDGWKATVGSNGIEFKTTGPLNLYGPTVNIAGEQVAIGSRGDLTVEGQRVDLTAEVLSLRPKKLKRTLETGGDTQEEQQVLIDGNLNVNLNAIIRGGAHVEGELSVQHITAPCEYHITETDFTYGVKTEPKVLPNPDPKLCYYGENGKTEPQTADCEFEPQKSPTYGTLLDGAYIGKAVGYDSAGNPLCLDVYSLKAENAVVVDPHVHYFKNIACKLFDENANISVNAGFASGQSSMNAHDAVRAVGSRNNWTLPVLPLPVKNSTSGATVTEKFGGKCETLSINKTDLQETSVADGLPSGEGVRTSKYTDQNVANRVKVLEAELEAKYAEIKKALADIKAAQV